MDVLIDRAANRWTCRTCQATYNYRVNPPKVPGVCDIDGGELYQREDDRIDVVSERIKVYLEDTVPVVEYYREREILCELDGTQDIPTVAAEIERHIQAIASPRQTRV
jgi:adenylate kinase